MPKQFTFRTTNDTYWIEIVLESIVDRSEFIREMLIEGMKSKGITSEIVLQGLTERDTVSDNVRRTQTVQKTVIYSYNKKEKAVQPRDTKYASTRTNVEAIKAEFEPVIQVLDDDETIDLEQALSNIASQYD